MILALSGLHSAGKSHLASLVGIKFGWKVYIKRDLLRELHTHEGYGDDWVAWYKELYITAGSYLVTKKILDLIPNDDCPIILDSVHNLMEWRAIKDTYPTSILGIVIAPRLVRTQRNDPEDAVLDIQRVHFWHEYAGGSSECLASEAEWTFNGSAPATVQEIEFQAFLDYLNNR